ncbi:Ig-like domain-containing protein [Botryobacter ruber]|uniref:Ig-like domain-containing protein n=1 Tax=Botryobacter ruber TaxID=2171629 RepID=UPI000E0A74F6|nr:Ig-like domain-containing protein [Botryobacter ruber]
MKLAHLLLTAATTGILGACASVSSPEGGPKDETNPSLVSSTPTQGELNVKTQVITLDFDEEVQPNKLNSELLITPNVDNKFTVLSKRERLQLTFEKPLEENTTYTLNFREGVQDITEKNPAKDLRLTFSTGNYIDSSRVSGKVMQLLTQTPEKEAIVALYPITDTLNIRKNPPYYQAMTNEAGEFSFENIKEGEYRLFALIDKNKNSYYDNESERIGYKENPISVTPTTDSVLLQTVRIDTKKPLPPRREQFQDRVLLTYNEGLTSIKGTPVENPKDSILYKMQEDGKIVHIFAGNGFTGGRAVFSVADSAGNQSVDSLTVAFEGKRSQLIRGAAFKVAGGKGGTTATYRKGQPVTIEMQTPVKVTGPEPIALLADSVVVQNIKYPEQITLDKTATELTFTLPATNNKINQLIVKLDSTAIVPVQGAPLQLPNLTIIKAEEKGTGSVKGAVVSDYKSYFIQLLNSEGQLLKEVQNQKTFHFRNLEPGAYAIRVLVDEDNNGKWRSGDPKLRQEPEKVYMYPKPIEIRANWDLDDVRLVF